MCPPVHDALLMYASGLQCGNFWVEARVRKGHATTNLRCRRLSRCARPPPHELISSSSASLPIHKSATQQSSQGPGQASCQKAGFPSATRGQPQRQGRKGGASFGAVAGTWWQPHCPAGCCVNPGGEGQRPPAAAVPCRRWRLPPLQQLGAGCRALMHPVLIYTLRANMQATELPSACALQQHQLGTASSAMGACCARPATLDGNGPPALGRVHPSHHTHKLQQYYAGQVQSGYGPVPPQQQAYPPPALSGGYGAPAAPPGAAAYPAPPPGALVSQHVVMQR